MLDYATLNVRTINGIKENYFVLKEIKDGSYTKTSVREKRVNGIHRKDTVLQFKILFFRWPSWHNWCCITCIEVLFFSLFFSSLQVGGLLF